MLEKKSWKEFKDAGLFWWINRMLHLFGWAIVYDCDNNGNVVRVYPARCKFRGFSENCEDEGFLKLTSYISENIKEIRDDLDDGEEEAQ